MNFRQRLQEAYQAGYRSGLNEAEGIEMGGDPRRPLGVKFGRPLGPGFEDPQKLIDDDLRRLRDIQREIQNREDNRNIRRYRDIKQAERRRRYV